MSTGPKVLIIEDRHDVSRLIKYLLKRAGADVTVAETGAQGLLAARTGCFDIITMDIDLPDMGGFEVFQYLRNEKEWKNVPVVFVSARSYLENGTGWMKLGAADFISKPFDAPGFAARVLSHVRSGTTRPEGEGGVPTFPGRDEFS